MKIFTIDEANSLLPVVEPKLLDIQRLYARVDILRDESRAAAAGSDLGGGMRGGSGYVGALYQIGRLTSELHELGVELKDHTSGLVDFPSMRGDRMVLLCWRLGEGDEIKWWHETDAGFAGRQPL